MNQDWKSKLPFFPLKVGKKQPANTGWQQQATSDAALRSEWQRLGRDEGIPTGAASNLLVIDVDRIGARERLEQRVGRPLPPTHTVYTSKDPETGFQKYQLYFQHNPIKLRNRAGIFGGIDIRTDGGFVVAAGARHIPNHQYESQDDLAPSKLPDDFAREIQLQQQKPSRVESGERPEKIKEGGRNETLARRAGELRARGFSGLAIDAALQVENRERCEPPLPISEVSAIAASIAQYTPAEAKARPKRKLFLKTSKSLEEVANEELRWLWHNVILAGALNLFIGLPDVGKTLVDIFIIAKLTRGDCFPFSKRRLLPRKVLVICREDSYASMWKPRLLGAGADLSMVIPLHGIGVEGSDELLPWFLDEAEHVTLLRDFLLADPEIALCVIDPLADMLGHRDMNKADDIRSVTGPLNRVAQETGVAMIVNVHTTKALIDSVIKSAAGSIQLMAAVQVSWLFIEDSDVKGQRLMLQGRNKSGRKRGFKYHIESAPWPDQCASRDLEEGEEDDGVGLVVFKGQSNADANDILQRKLDRDEPKNKQIRKWLLELLARGPVPNKHCNEEAFNRGFARDYVSHVCAQLRVIRNGKTWALPPEDAKSEPEREPEQEELENLEGVYSPWKKQ